MKKLFLCLMFSLVLFSPGFSQSPKIDFNKELDFIFFLGQNRQYNDLNFYTEKLIKNYTINIDQRDSLFFVLGYFNYKKSDYYKSSSYFSEVSNASLFYPKSSFYSILCYANRRSYDSAYIHLRKANFDENNDLLQQLKTFELAGLSLLKRNFSTYDSLSSALNTSDQLLLQERAYQMKYYNDLVTTKRKSPFVAGALSAIVPGLGLVYAGNNGQALSAFLQVGALAALSTETYLKSGPTDPQFIIYTTLFSFFYVGNVWGSVLSVQLVKNDKFKEIDNNIMVGLSIPIDRFFK